MKDLTEILDSTLLRDFEKSFTNELKESGNHQNIMKRCVLLCIMAEKIMAEIQTIDTKDYVDKLKEELEKLNADYQSHSAYLKMHSSENSRICDNIESVTDGLARIRKTTEDNIAEYDRLLQELISVRDSMSVFEAQKRQNGTA